MGTKKQKGGAIQLHGARPLRRQRKPRGIEKSTLGGDPNFILAVGLNLNLNRTQLIKPYAQHPYVYAAINAIAWNISGAPFRIMTGDRKDPKTLEDGEWVKLFDAPNRAMSKSTFWRMVMIYLLNCGETICTLHTKDGKPYEMGNVPASIVPHGPDRFTPIAEGDVITGWEYRNEKGEITTLKWWQVIQLKLPNPYNPLRGQSPLEAGMTEIRQDHKAGIFNESFFDNGCDMGGVITTGKPLTTSQRSEAQKKAESRHMGAEKRGRLMVLGSGEEYHPNTQTHLDMQFLEGKKSVQDTVATIFRVPKGHLNNYENVNYNTALSQDKWFWTGTVIPYIHDIEDVFWHQLFNRVDDGKVWGAFDLAGIEALNAGFSEKVDTAIKLEEMGYTANEANERLDLGMEEQEESEEMGPDAVQDTALNGAQITGLLQIVQAVRDGVIDEKGAVGLILVAFPTIDEAEAKRILGGVEVAPPEPEPKPAPAVEPTKAKRLEGDAAKALTQRAMDYVQKQYPLRERRWATRLRIFFGRQRAEVLRNLEERDKSMRLLARFKEVTEDDIEAILFSQEEWDKRLKVLARPLWREAAKAEVDTVAGELGGLDTFTAQDPNLLRYLAEKEVKVVGINETVRRELRTQLRDGIGAGESLQQIKDRIKGVYNIVGGDARRRTIARTETADVLNNTRALAFKAEGVEFVQWLTASDDAVRPSHEENHGEIRKLGMQFENGMTAPSEPGAPPEEVINCRCSLLAVKSEEDKG